MNPQHTSDWETGRTQLPQSNIMNSSQNTALEQMTCVELLDVIRLKHAIRNAESAGYDGFAMTLSMTLESRLKRPAIT